tara:strand:+ start:716 stop:928 length:213 start_codon:yes stop_codon:yes gene_type:complete
MKKNNIYAIAIGSALTYGGYFLLTSDVKKAKKDGKPLSGLDIATLKIVGGLVLIGGIATLYGSAKDIFKK